MGHIPGAVQGQRFKDLGDNDTNPLMRYHSREAFQERLRGRGVNDDSVLVLYDDSDTALLPGAHHLAFDRLVDINGSMREKTK